MVDARSRRASPAPKRELTIHLVRILFPGAGTAGRVGLVPRRPEQPRQVPAVLHRAGGLERRDDRHAALLRRPARRSTGWRWISRGARSPAASCSSPCRRRWPCRLSRHPGRAALTEPVRQAMRNFVPVLVSRGAVQLTALHRRLDRQLAARPARSPRWRTRSCSTRCRSACSASRSPRRSCPRCPATRPSADGFARAARAHRRGPAAAGLLRHPVRRRLRRARRRHRRRAAAARPVRGRRRALRLGRSSRDRRSACSRRRWRGCIRSAHYAVGDTKRPLRFALVRLVVVDGARLRLCAIVLPPRLGIDPRWGAAGLTASAGVAGWIEFALLRASLNRRIGRTGLAGVVHGAALDRRTRRRPRSRGASGCRCRRWIRSSAAPRCCRPSARRFLGGRAAAARSAPRACAGR